MRIRFDKTGKIRFTSHRDVARMWERCFRRAVLPVAYTEGFSPRPKLHFGLALSTGHESLAEYLDVDFVHDVDPDTLPGLLTPLLPTGLEVTAAAPIERSAPSLQADVVACSWRFDLNVAPTTLADRCAAVLAQPEVRINRSRKGVERNDDIRPAIEGLVVSEWFRTPDSPVGARLEATLATLERGLRPQELLEVLVPDVDDIDECTARVLRTQQWMEHDGVRAEPLQPVVAEPSARTEVCV
jgi:radical SAM-linked protein